MNIRIPQVPERARRAGFVLAAVLLVAGGAIAGSIVAVESAGAKVYRTSLATVSVEASASRTGHVDVYVPLVDWDVSVRPYRAPVAIEMQVRAIDRDEARAALGSGDAARAALERLQREVEIVLRQAVQRAYVLSVAGGLVGGALAGVVLAAWTMRRRLVPVGAVAGCALSLVVTHGSVTAVQQFDEGRLDEPTFTARGAELPRLLAFSEQLLTAGAEYKDHYSKALASLSNVFHAAENGTPSFTSSVLVASDIHNNTLVLDAFDRFARDTPVVLAGDFGQVGHKVEERMAPRIGRLGGRVIAVSGNHDSHALMRSLARAGVTVLRSDGGVLRPDGSQPQREVRINGLLVAGYDDPLEGRTAIGARKLRVYGEEYEQHARDFIAWFDALPQRPDIVVLHQHGLAHRLLKELEQRGDERRLIIFTGHDHIPHVEEVGPHLLVDGGSLGAGGPASIGEQDASFAQVHFDGSEVRAVDFISIEPLGGTAEARRVLVGSAARRQSAAESAARAGAERFLGPGRATASASTTASG